MHPVNLYIKYKHSKIHYTGITDFALFFLGIKIQGSWVSMGRIVLYADNGCDLDKDVLENIRGKTILYDHYDKGYRLIWIA